MEHVSKQSRILSKLFRAPTYLGKLWAVLTGIPITIMALTPFALIAVFFPHHTRVAIMQKAWFLFGSLLLRVSLLARITIRDERSDKKLKGLYIVNHKSFIDIPLFACRIQIPPIMKKEVLYIPFVGFAAWASRSIVVDRKDKNSRAKALVAACRRLKKGIAVQMYPEGTRSRGPGPKPLEKIHRKIIDFAYQNNIPVTSIALYGTDQVLGPNGNPRLGQRLGMKIAKPLYPDNYLDKDRFAKDCWDLVLEGHRELAIDLADHTD